MDYKCSRCTIKKEVQKKKEALGEVMKYEDYNLLSEEIVRKSQDLDELIYKCVTCKKNGQHMEKANVNNVSGTHPTFYYYGYDHLILNLIYYIKPGIKNNELVYCSMDYHIYDRLIEALKLKGITQNEVVHFSFKDFILTNKKCGFEAVKSKVKQLTAQMEKINKNRIRFIGQPTFAIKETSKDDFIYYEESLTAIFEGTDASVLCIYDALDYINHSEYIDEEIINQSLDTHTHIYSL